VKTNIHYRNISEPSNLGLEIRVRALALHHLERHLSTFSPELVQLHADLAKGEHRESYLVKLRLRLPSAVLVSVDEECKLDVAMRAAFADLERQLKRHMAHLRLEENWRRKQRREGLRRLESEANGVVIDN
jgi:ribosome-associated translation inhibitor RaiA